MTRDKDFKRLVRTRMRRTGEPYTAARAALEAVPPAAEVRRREAERRQRHLVDRWFDHGRLRSIPARRKVRAAVLLEVLTRFVPGLTYTERDVSRLLERVHPDFASLRRELISLGYLERQHGIYWVCRTVSSRSERERRELPEWEQLWLPGFADRGPGKQQAQAS